MIRRLLLLGVTISLTVVSVSCGPCDRFYEVSFRNRQPDKKVDIMIDGKYFTSYLYGEDLTKPVLFPVCSPCGVALTRSYPLGAKVEGESEDHPHHMGVFFTYDRVNDDGFWNNKTSPPQIRHIKFTGITQERGLVRICAIMHWVGKSGQALLEEDRRMTFRGNCFENYIDFSIDLKALDEKVVFGDTKEGMFAIRTAHWLREHAGKNWPEGMLPTARYLSSNGDETARNVWGKRAKWVRLEGEKAGRTFGIAVFNHPSSVNYPTYWHARDYGLFSADPLGQGYFQKARKLENPEYLNLTLEPGEKAHFGFRMIFYEGPRTKEELEKRFEDYVKGSD